MRLKALAHIGKLPGALDRIECAACAFECGTVGGECVAAGACRDLDAFACAFAHDGELDAKTVAVAVESGEVDVHSVLSVWVAEA